MDHRNSLSLLRHFMDDDNYEEAIQLATEISALNPYDGHVYMLKGLAELQVNRLVDAEHSFVAAIDSGLLTLDPFYYLATTHGKLGNFSQAQAVIEQGLQVIGEPEIGTHWAEPLSRLYSFIHQHENCVYWAKQALRNDPQDLTVLKRLGASLSILQHPKEALDAYHQVLKLEPNDAHLHWRLSSVLRQLRELDAAQKHLEMAGRLDPNRYDPATLFMLSASRLDFAKRAKYRDEALKKAECGEHVTDAFSYFFATDDPQIIRKANVAYSQHFPAPTRKMARSRRSDEARIKVGYLSADFKDHATTYLIDGLIKAHNRDSFHITGFDFSENRASRSRETIQKNFDQIVDLMPYSHEDAAEIISTHNIDILVDLKGFTEHSRPQILGYRPARVQVNYLGYPGTTGYHALDYIIGDSLVFGPNSSEDFTEAQVTLPCCYQPNNPNRLVAEAFTRADQGLPENVFIFSCFNHHWKMSEEIFYAWKTILDACPKSILWVMDAVSRTDTKTKLEEIGIDSARIFVAPLLPIHQHLSRLRLANLFLDTFPCGAHTTASDSIFGGVPVLTIMGRAFHSRVSASIMAHAGCPEYICMTLDEYLEKAIACYQHPEIITDSQKKLIQFQNISHPYNVDTTAKSLEAAFHTMLERGKEVAPIKIDPWWT